jgi:hypothetical protein
MVDTHMYVAEQQSGGSHHCLDYVVAWITSLLGSRRSSVRIQSSRNHNPAEKLAIMLPEVEHESLTKMRLGNGKRMIPGLRAGPCRARALLQSF